MCLLAFCGFGLCALRLRTILICSWILWIHLSLKDSSVFRKEAGGHQYTHNSYLSCSKLILEDILTAACLASSYPCLYVQALCSSDHDVSCQPANNGTTQSCSSIWRESHSAVKSHVQVCVQKKAQHGVSSFQSRLQSCSRGTVFRAFVWVGIGCECKISHTVLVEINSKQEVISHLLGWQRFKGILYVIRTRGVMIKQWIDLSNQTNLSEASC